MLLDVQRDVFSLGALAPSAGDSTRSATDQARRRRTPQTEGRHETQKETNREGYQASQRGTSKTQQEAAHEASKENGKLGSGDVGGEDGPLIKRARFVGKDVQWLAAPDRTVRRGRRERARAAWLVRGDAVKVSRRCRTRGLRGGVGAGGVT